MQYQGDWIPTETGSDRLEISMGAWLGGAIRKAAGLVADFRGPRPGSLCDPMFSCAGSAART